MGGDVAFGTVPKCNGLRRLEAADQALVNGNQEAAISYLKKECHARQNWPEQVSISAKLADVMWHYNPSTAKRYLPDLVTAVENGYLGAQQSVQVIMNLLWQGEVAQASALLELLREISYPEVTDHVISYVDQLQLWLPLTYPGIAPGKGHGDAPPGNIIAPTWAPEQRAAAALGAVLRGVREANPSRAAERVLREARAGVASPASSIASLVTLI